MMQLSNEEKAELAEVYERAAEYLERHGWQKYALGRAGHPTCFNGATYLASVNMNKTDLWRVSARFAAEALELDSFTEIPNWNDDPDRTADEVINTLHALANKLR